MLLQGRELQSVRGERVLFSNINLDVASGQLWQIEGPNGAGKSSLLRILAGLLPAQQGDVLFQGEEIQQCRERYYHDLLFIGHKSGIKPELTAIENLEFYAAVEGHEFSTPPYELLAQVGLVGLEDIPAQRLSAGQQRRIALARLWFSQTRLWILDEPFTALDVDGIAMLHDRFQVHLAQGGAIILTSHQDLQSMSYPVNRLQLRYQH
ncbi:MAG: cytochrome c biogenesis heme-transporting ATPase CcmA [Aliidiomarina sp.]|uniref:cytochrome c biogenesis heme-transporting ATPase CcmA n=1 Tax=Aliidiomarina sp. TaxID=1872439 RepID=UPI0025C2CBD9|nr:cytochrome c biogenesis heme-transporting ATPase CcmA [Aliidiomarina sp.]MCH8502234.1 cytochrome c biogenesis heme-transporting ATPase CcmA [Aliidiomarina sp.]